MTTGTSSAGGKHRGFDAAAIDALGVHIRGLAIDSRNIKPGDLFLAYPGQRSDGRAHIAQAIGAGASAVLWDSSGFHWNTAWRVPNLGVVDLRSHLGEIASRFFGNPPRDLWLWGVTRNPGPTFPPHWDAHSLAPPGRQTARIATF